jgi:hypothetical protein
VAREVRAEEMERLDALSRLVSGGAAETDSRRWEGTS